jgi:hypothetical protein
MEALGVKKESIVVFPTSERRRREDSLPTFVDVGRLLCAYKKNQCVRVTVRDSVRVRVGVRVRVRVRVRFRVRVRCMGALRRRVVCISRGQAWN